MAHADSVQAGLMKKVREVEVWYEGIETEGWSWGRSSESFMGSLGPSPLEEVDGETNRWKEERKDIGGVDGTCVTLDLEIVEKAPFGDSGHENLPLKTQITSLVCVFNQLWD